MPGDKLTALVLGGANCLDNDKARAAELFDPDLIVACNHAGRDEPGRIDHWATMHPALFPKWIKDRAQAGRPDAGQLWHAKHRPSPIESKEITSLGGSSGLLCVSVALELGATHVILAGIPMSKTFCHYDRPEMWFEARQYWPAWERYAEVISPKVKSLSGWTSKLLGMPSEKWLADDKS